MTSLPDYHPLADRMRPQSVDEFAGQQHILAPEKPLRVAIENGRLHSMVFWGHQERGKPLLPELFQIHVMRNLFHFQPCSVV